MSDHLVYLARTSRFGERFASRKLAMIALCNAASDGGEAIVMGAAEIAEAAELADVKSAMRVRRELVATGLVEVVDGEAAHPQPGQGRGAKGIYRINVARLKALHERAWDYVAEVRALRAEKGGVTPPKEEPDAPERVARDHPKPGAADPGKGGAMGVSMGDSKGVSMGGTAPTSSIKDSTSYWIDDLPDLQLPGWAVEEVKQLEPERWPVLVEAFLRWEGARKAVDIGRAFIGWARKVLGLNRGGKGRSFDRGDWAMIYAMAGLKPDEVARHGVPLPSRATLSARSRGTGDWRQRLRSSGAVTEAEVAP